MRKLAAIVLTIALGAALPAGQAFGQDRIKVVTSFTILADMAQNVAGDAADVVSITRPGAEVHNYQPTPRDLLGAQGADLILYNGLNLELWFEQFLGNLGDVPRAVASEGVEPIGIGEGPYSGKPNPHAWMSASDAAIYVENIAAALSAADPDNAGTYAANAARYVDEIEAVFGPLREAVAGLDESRRWLVTSEGAFSYLARDLGLREAFLWPINADQQGTPQQVRRVIDLVRAESIPVVFSESTISPDPAMQVARETGAAYGGVLYVDSLSEPDGPVPTYLDLLRVTGETIVAGLSE